MTSKSLILLNLTMMIAVVLIIDKGYKYHNSHVQGI